MLQKKFQLKPAAPTFNSCKTIKFFLTFCYRGELKKSRQSGEKVCKTGREAESYIYEVDRCSRTEEEGSRLNHLTRGLTHLAKIPLVLEGKLRRLEIEIIKTMRFFFDQGGIRTFSF